MSTGYRWALVVAGVLALGVAPGGADPAPTPAEWRADLEVLTTTLERVHPDLYARVSRDEFAAAVAALDQDIPRLGPEQVSVRMMQLVALVRDGHTQLEPVDPAGFGTWFPIRFYRFADGIYVTAAASQHRDLVGARVLEIGSLPVEQAWARAATLMGADNEMGRDQNAPLMLANAMALRTLGITADTDTLGLEVQLASGEEERVAIRAVEAGYDLEFRFWGEIWGPASGSEEVRYVTAFADTADDHYDKGSDLPLHVRYRSAFWFTWREEEALLYAQINSVGNSRRAGRFDDFVRDFFATADAKQPELVVLDLRYNIGGDGSLVKSLVHELIKRDALNRKGKLFVIVGRATFSAGVMLVHALDEHTEATFVGEPPGAYYQHYGDGTSFELPHSGLRVWVSTIYHQLSAYTTGQHVMPIELPAAFDSSDYFAGSDPALEEIFASRQRPLLANVFREQGGEAALAEYERRLQDYGGVWWWAPFTLGELNSLGHELLEAGRPEDALAAYQLNARRHPDHWRPWFSLGRAYRQLGQTEPAIRNYERALEVDPYNNLAPYQREALAELRTTAGQSGR